MVIVGFSYMHVYGQEAEQYLLGEYIDITCTVECTPIKVFLHLCQPMTPFDIRLPHSQNQLHPTPSHSERLAFLPDIEAVANNA